MPFQKKIETFAGTIGIWELSETSSEMLRAFTLSENEKAAYRQFKIEKRRKEFLASRLLLNKLLGKKTEVEYSPDGKPSLTGNKLNISISHSSDFAVVLLSEQNAGIDVENIHRNIDAVADKFMAEKETEDIDKLLGDKQSAKIVYWCAKEAIFKCTPVEEIDFKGQIKIRPFELRENGIFGATLHRQKTITRFKLEYLFLQNNALVYCVEENKTKK